MEEFCIPITEKAVAHGLKVGVKVYKDKSNFKDKWFIGGASELQADVYGFIAETVVDEYFNKPFPELTPQQVDAFDLILKGMRVDVKEVSKDGGFLYLTQTELNKRLEGAFDEEHCKSLKAIQDLTNEYSETVKSAKIHAREKTAKKILLMFKTKFKEWKEDKFNFYSLDDVELFILEDIKKRFLVKSEVQKE